MKTREAILKIAEEEFARLGYDAVSMNELEKKININQATVYYHFEDKKSLYQEVIKDILEELNFNIKSIFRTNLEGEILFRSYINAIIISMRNRPTIIPLALRELANFGSNIDESVIPFIDEEIKYIEIILSKMNIKEEYKDINPYVLMSLIHGTIKEFYVIQMSELSIGGKSELKNDSKKTLNYVADFVSNMVLDTLVKDHRILK